MFDSLTIGNASLIIKTLISWITQETYRIIEYLWYMAGKTLQIQCDLKI